MMKFTALNTKEIACVNGGAVHVVSVNDSDSKCSQTQQKPGVIHALSYAVEDFADWVDVKVEQAKNAVTTAATFGTIYTGYKLARGIYGFTKKTFRRSKTSA